MAIRPERQGIQLAYPAEEGRVSRLGETFYCQPKLNGERCKVVPFHGEPVFLSSYGNEFKFLDHLKKSVMALWKEIDVTVSLDGEIYIHGWDRERIDSALRRRVNKSEETKYLEYHIFDLPIPLSQDIRLQMLSNWLNLPANLYSVPTFLADATTWVIYTETFIELGYEGSILRKKGAVYTEKRTVNMLKYKPTEFDTYKIVDLHEAISKEGEAKGMVGAFEVDSGDGGTFKVGAGKLKHLTRTAYWRQRHALKGRMLKVKHGKIVTSKGIPTPVVAVEVLSEHS